MQTRESVMKKIILMCLLVFLGCGDSNKRPSVSCACAKVQAETWNNSLKVYEKGESYLIQYKTPECIEDCCSDSFEKEYIVEGMLVSLEANRTAVTLYECSQRDKRYCRDEEGFGHTVDVINYVITDKDYVFK